MKRGFAAVLLVVQLVLVLSVAGKYLYERKTRPRVWTRTTQFDPNAPLRGRYLALQLAVDGCGLPHDARHFTQGFQQYNSTAIGPGSYSWRVSLDVQGGHLVPQLQDDARSPEGMIEMTQVANWSCERVPLSGETEFFVPDTAKTPFPLKNGQELWVEVTVPKSGPPRPIQVAVSDPNGFHPIQFE